MKRLALVAGALFYLVLGTGVAPTRAAQTYVNMSDTAYSPATVRVAVNDDVFWCNPSGTDHSVNNPDFNKEFPAHSGCSGRTFQTAGTFNYTCSHVPGMSGTVIVGSGGPSPTAAPATTRGSGVTTTTRRSTVTTAAASHSATTVLHRSAASATTSTTFIDEASTSTTSTTSSPSGTVALPARHTGGNNTATVAALVATAVITAASGTFLALRAHALRR